MEGPPVQNGLYDVSEKEETFQRERATYLYEFYENLHVERTLLPYLCRR